MTKKTVRFDPIPEQAQTTIPHGYLSTHEIWVNDFQLYIAWYRPQSEIYKIFLNKNQPRYFTSLHGIKNFLESR